MTQMILKGAAFGLLVGGLTACASAPVYPINGGRTSTPGAPKAETPIASTPAPPAPAPSTAAAPDAAPPPVESQPLAPVRSPGFISPAPIPVTPAPRALMQEAPRIAAAPIRYTATGKVVSAGKMFRSYVVRKGDHLDAIARDLDTTRAVLVEANKLKRPDSLNPGQRLKVPIEKAYLVQAGDTVFAVAKRFDVSVANLADLNAITETHKLRAGDQLALPSVFHDSGPVVAAPVRASLRPAPYVYRPSPPNTGSSVGQGRPYPPAIAAAGSALTDAQVMAAGRGRFVWPVTGGILSTFGVKDVGRSNDGIDVRAPQGSVVHAAAAGDVVYAGDQVPGFGNLVLIKHANGWVTAYAHLDKVSVKMRQSVAQGQEIGQVGQSGGVSEPQLHFEVRYAPTPADKARPIDPQLVLPK